MEEPLLPSPLCEKELEDVMVLLHPPFISKSVAKQLSGARTLKFDMITTDCETTDEEAIATNNGSAGLTDKQLSPEEGFDVTVSVNLFQWSLKSPITGVTVYLLGHF
jgi:hypothetical protein